jgi:hypothetical protein
MLLYSYKFHHSDIQIVTPEGKKKKVCCFNPGRRLEGNGREGICNPVVEMPSARHPTTPLNHKEH